MCQLCESFPKKGCQTFLRNEIKFSKIELLLKTDC